MSKISRLGRAISDKERGKRQDSAAYAERPRNLAEGGLLTLAEPVADGFSGAVTVMISVTVMIWSFPPGAEIPGRRLSGRSVITGNRPEAVREGDTEVSKLLCTGIVEEGPAEVWLEAGVEVGCDGDPDSRVEESGPLVGVAAGDVAGVDFAGEPPVGVPELKTGPISPSTAFVWKAVREAKSSTALEAASC